MQNTILLLLDAAQSKYSVLRAVSEMELVVDSDLAFCYIYMKASKEGKLLARNNRSLNDIGCIQITS